MPIFTKTVDNAAYVALRDNFMCSLTSDEYFALEAYTSSTYSEINKTLLNGQSDSSYQPIIDSIYSALRKSASDAIPALYRGTLQEHIAHLVEGEETTFPFFMSASTDPLVADRFAGNESPAVIVIKNLQRGYAAVSISQLDEYEVLISPDTKFRVEKITTGADFQAEYDKSGYYAPVKNNVTVVEMTVI